MKSIILSICIFLFLANTNAQEVICNDLKTGYFNSIDNDGSKYSFQRTARYQIEIVGDIKVRFKVKWLDDCSYKLIFKKGNNAWWEMMGEDKQVPDVTVIITATEGNTYYYEAFINSRLIIKGKIEKVKEL